jgi:uncharacterized membrane protein YkgB
MATSELRTTRVFFTSNGTDINAEWTASLNTFTLFSTAGANNTVSLENAASFSFTDSTGGGTLSITPAATTTSYSLILPDAQGTAGQILENDGAGNLSWADPELSAGNLGDIQYSDGSGGFDASTTSIFNYTDGVSSTLDVGVNAGTFTLQGANGTTLAGTTINLAAGTGGSGAVNGGSIDLTAGDQTTGNGDGGSVTISTGNSTTTGNGGDLSLATGDAAGGGLGSSSTLSGGTGADGGSIDLSAGDGTATNGANITLEGGQAAQGGDLSLTAGNGGAQDGGDIIFTTGSGSTDGSYFFTVSNTPATPLVTILGVSENATSTSTGTVRIDSGGLGVAADIYSTNLTCTNQINLEGSVSGTFTQQAAATTTDYTITWPDAQAVSPGQVLENNGAGVLSWADAVASAGNAGDIQYSDGAGGFDASTQSIFNYTDGSPASTLAVGVENGTFTLSAADGATLAGSNLTMTAGDGGTGAVQGGILTLQSGAQTAGTGAGGNINFTASQGSTNGGSIIVSSGIGNGGDGGNITTQPGTGTGNNGVIEFLAADATVEEFFQIQTSTGTNTAAFLSTAQNATSKATGTLRIFNGGGIGADGDIFAENLQAASTLVLNGATSGSITQQAAATTTTYTITWPDAQATLANQVLTNDGAGTLTWEDAAVSAGSQYAIQLSDGAGGFEVPSTGVFEYEFTGIDSDFRMGQEGAQVNILAADATVSNGCSLVFEGGAPIDTTSGGAITITGGGSTTGTDRTGGNVTVQGGAHRGGGAGGGGGNVGLIGGSGTSTNSSGNVFVTGGSVPNGGNVTISAGNLGDVSMSTSNVASGTAGDVTIAAGSSTAGTGGNVILTITSGSSTPGSMIFNGGEAAGTTDAFIFRDSGSTQIVAMPSGVQNSTSTSTGSIRVPGGGGIGVTGDIYCNTVNAVSDIRFKKDTELLSTNECLEALNEIHPYKYRLRSTNERHCGVIAQEIMHHPLIKAYIVKGNKDEKSIDYHGIIALLIGSVHDLNDRLTKIQTQFDSLLSTKTETIPHA